MINRITQKVKIKQHDSTDCGAACLASVSAFYKLELPIARIRQLASTDKKGTNMLGLIEAAQNLGYSAKGVKGPFDSLYRIPLPAIAHIILENKIHHYVVLYKVTRNYVVIMDPMDGRIHKTALIEFEKLWTGVLLLLVPSEKFSPGSYVESVWKRFASLIMPYKAIMLQALFGAVIYSLLGLTTAIYVQKIIDFVLVDGNINLLHMMSVTMILILVLKVYIGIMKNVFALKTGQRIDATLILGYYKHLLTLPQQFFDTMRVGEIISRINDAAKIRSFINNTSLEIIVNFLIVLFTLALMFVFSFKLALIVLIGIPFYGIVYYYFNKINRGFLRKIMENSAELESHLVESVNSIATIKHFGAEDFSNIKTELKFVRLLKTSYRSLQSSILTNSATEFIAGGLIIAVLWFGSTQVLQHEITPGILLSFYALVGYLIVPISQLIRANQTVQDALIASDRLFQIMDLEREEDEDQRKMILTRELIGDIKFKNISFRYGSRLQLFDNFNLIISKGKVTAIVGESGSGKSTLIALLHSLYPIQAGTIEIGDYNIRHISMVSLRERIVVVPQKIELFAGTIIENIALGDYEPDMKKVIDICNTLNITSFIEKLPGGFYTQIGERGVSLSGGEKQKIAIARALYFDPEILVLDEATSALDSFSENYVKKAVDYLKSQGKTIVLIAHRLSTVMIADKICLLKEGMLIEEGSHDKLLKSKGNYYTMWKEQFPMLN